MRKQKKSARGNNWDWFALPPTPKKIKIIIIKNNHLKMVSRYAPVTIFPGRTTLYCITYYIKWAKASWTYSTFPFAGFLLIQPPFVTLSSFHPFLDRPLTPILIVNYFRKFLFYHVCHSLTQWLLLLGLYLHDLALHNTFFDQIFNDTFLYNLHFYSF